MTSGVEPHKCLNAKKTTKKQQQAISILFNEPDFRKFYLDIFILKIYMVYACPEQKCQDMDLIAQLKNKLSKINRQIYKFLNKKLSMDESSISHQIL